METMFYCLSCTHCILCCWFHVPEGTSTLSWLLSGAPWVPHFHPLYTTWLSSTMTIGLLLFALLSRFIHSLFPSTSKLCCSPHLSWDLSWSSCSRLTCLCKEGTRHIYTSIAEEIPQCFKKFFTFFFPLNKEGEAGSPFNIKYSESSEAEVTKFPCFLWWISFSFLVDRECVPRYLHTLGEGGGEVKNLHHWGWGRASCEAPSAVPSWDGTGRPFHCVLETGDSSVIFIFKKKVLDFFG